MHIFYIGQVLKTLSFMGISVLYELCYVVFNWWQGLRLLHLLKSTGFNYKRMTHKFHYLDTGLFKQLNYWKKNNKGWSMYKSSFFLLYFFNQLWGKQRAYIIHCSVRKTSEEYTCKILIQVWRKEKETLLLAPHNNS